MKKILFVFMCSFSIFILGCDKLSNETEEVVPEEEVISEDIGDNALQDQNNNDTIGEALKLARQQRNAGDFDEAIKIYTEIIEQNPKDFGLYACRGSVRREKGDFNGAIEDIDKALELNPNESGLYLERATTYQSKGEDNLALQDYKKALELDSSLLDWVKPIIQELEAK